MRSMGLSAYAATLTATILASRGTRGSTAAKYSATTSCLIVRAQERKSWRMIDGRMEALYPPPRT